MSGYRRLSLVYYCCAWFIARFIAWFIVWSIVWQEMERIKELGRQDDEMFLLSTERCCRCKSLRSASHKNRANSCVEFQEKKRRTLVTKTRKKYKRDSRSKETLASLKRPVVPNGKETTEKKKKEE